MRQAILEWLDHAYKTGVKERVRERNEQIRQLYTDEPMVIGRDVQVSKINRRKRRWLTVGLF